MSFILDALRRADAQRERDSSRGIHAQGGPMPGGQERSLRTRAALPWAGLALLLALAAAGAWYGLSSGMARVPKAAPGVPVPQLSNSLVAMPAAPATPRPANAISPPAPVILASDGGDAADRERPGWVGYRRATAPGQAGASAADGQQAPPTVAHPPAPSAPQPAQVPPPQAVPQRSPTPPASPQTASPMPTRPGQGPGPAQAAAPAAAVPPAPSPLPPDAPKLSVSGGVYSSNAARRMVIVNGQVVREGAEPVPGVVVEQIQPNATVLRYRGQRYTATY